MALFGLTSVDVPQSQSPGASSSTPPTTAAPKSPRNTPPTPPYNTPNGARPITPVISYPTEVTASSQPATPPSPPNTRPPVLKSILSPASATPPPASARGRSQASQSSSQSTPAPASTSSARHLPPIPASTGAHRPSITGGNGVSPELSVRDAWAASQSKDPSPNLNHTKTSCRPPLKPNEDQRCFDGKELSELVKLMSEDYSDVAKMQGLITIALAGKSPEAAKAEALLQIREASFHNPLFSLTPVMVQLVREQLMSRNRLLRPAAAYALAGYAANSRHGRGLLTAHVGQLLPRLNAMMRCKVDSMDARYASLAVLTASMHSENKERVGASGAIPLLVGLLRQTVGRPSHKPNSDSNLEYLLTLNRSANSSLQHSMDGGHPDVGDANPASPYQMPPTPQHARASARLAAAAAMAAGGFVSIASHLVSGVPHDYQNHMSLTNGSDAAPANGTAIGRASMAMGGTTLGVAASQQSGTALARASMAAAGTATGTATPSGTATVRGSISVASTPSIGTIVPSGMTPRVSMAAGRVSAVSMVGTAPQLAPTLSNGTTSTAPRPGSYILNVKPAAVHAAAALVNLAEIPSNRQRMREAGIVGLLEDVLASRNENPIKERCRLLVDFLQMDTRRYKDAQAASQFAAITAVSQAIVNFVQRGKEGHGNAATTAAATATAAAIIERRSMAQATSSGGASHLNGSLSSGAQPSLGLATMRNSIAWNLVQQLEEKEESPPQSARRVATVRHRSTSSLMRPPSRSLPTRPRSQAQTRRSLSLSPTTPLAEVQAAAASAAAAGNVGGGVDGGGGGVGVVGGS